MKNFLRRKMAFFTIFLLSLICSGIVVASSYQTYFYLEHELKGPTRYFDGTNIAFEASPKTYPRPENPDAKPSSSFYTVTLYREYNWFNKAEIGSVVLPRDAFGKANWTNVGSITIFTLKKTKTGWL